MDALSNVLVCIFNFPIVLATPAAYSIALKEAPRKHGQVHEQQLLAGELLERLALEL
jgi:hypothetical protein